jgi:hypothetical protein
MSWYASRFLTDEECLSDADFKREPVKEPAKRWRNKFFWTGLQVFASGETRGPGVEWGKNIWPSREVAETKAIEAIEEWARTKTCGRYLIMADKLYIGPVEEPNEN